MNQPIRSPDDMRDRLRKEDWEVRPLPLSVARQIVEKHHYAKGASNTFVYLHGLFRRGDPAAVGVAWWLPPTRVACESVNRFQWRRVLSLSRMVILPGTPKNAASFLLSRSVKLIRNDGRFVTLVTYADESQGHTGCVYRSANWQYAGRTGPYPRWLDLATGRQVAPKSTINRTKAEMLALGYQKQGSFHKHKFILQLGLPKPDSHFAWILAP